MVRLDYTAQSIERYIFEQYQALLIDWIPKGASIAIAVEYKFAYFLSGHENIVLKIGSAVPPDSIAYKVIEKRKKIDAVMDNSLFDTPYYAIGYPIEINGLASALVIVLPPLFHNEKLEAYQFLTGKQDEDWVPVPINEISHIESLQKKTWFYRKGESFSTQVPLKELQTRLPDQFIRIHRSFIININFIERITRDIASNFVIILKDGSELPVSQSYVNTVRKVLEF